MFWDLNKQTGITKLEKGLPDKVAIYLWGQWIMKAKCTKHISTKVSKQPQKLKSIYKNVIDWTKNPFSFVLPHKHSSMTAGPFLKKLKKKKKNMALTGIAQWTERGLQTKGSPVRFPIRAQLGPVPQLGHVRGNHMLIFLSLSFSLPSSLSKNK